MFPKKGNVKKKSFEWHKPRQRIWNRQTDWNGIDNFSKFSYGHDEKIVSADAAE